MMLSAVEHSLGTASSLLAMLSPDFSPCHLVTLSPCHLFATFPRGPGLYYHPVKLVAVLVVYLCWVKTCWWVDTDAKALKLPRKTWNPVLLGCGLFGLLVVWVLPWFWLSFSVLVLLYFGATLTYVAIRNEEVEPEDKVLTIRHLRRL